MASKLENILQKKWALPLLRLLDKEGELNFNVMLDELSISSSTLTETKDLLMDYGLIHRHEFKRTDIRYELTSDGEIFLGKVRELESILDSNHDQ